MKKLIMCIGLIVFTCLLIAVPILFALAIEYRWNGFISFVLTIALGIEWLWLIDIVWERAQKDTEAKNE